MAERTGRGLYLRRVIVESLAVMASILLAFAIDAWWDGHLDRRQEASLLAGILADYRDSRPELESRLELARRMSANTELLIDAVSGTTGSSITVPDSLVLGSIGGPTYEPSTSTLDAAIASGEIELIRGDEIHRELATWRRTLIDTTEDEVEVRRITNVQLVPALSRTMDLAPYFRELLAWSFEEPVTGLPGNVTIVPDTELAGLLAVRHFFVQFAADDLANLLASLDRAVGLIENGTR